MKEMSVNEALGLIRAEAKPAISLFVGTNVQERDGAVRIKSNLQCLYRTAEALILKTYEGRTREKLLMPLKKALGALRLNRSRGGVAIYHSEDLTRVVRLPTAVSDLAVAAHSFHIKPLLRCMQVRRSYMVLAFRKNFADLVLVTADTTRRIERIDFGADKAPLLSDSGAVKRGFKDGLKMRRQKDMKNQMFELNRRLESHWHENRVPLLLAGPHLRVEAFRAECSYPKLLDRSLNGLVENLDYQALATLSATIVEQHFNAIDRQVVVAFRQAYASGLGSIQLEKIAAAAARGQVQSLIIAEDRQVWGRLDRDNGDLELVGERQDATSDDLLDDLAELTILKGGTVTVLPSFMMPADQPIAAVLRWRDDQESAPLPMIQRPTLSHWRLPAETRLQA